MKCGADVLQGGIPNQGAPSPTPRSCSSTPRPFLGHFEAVFPPDHFPSLLITGLIYCSKLLITLRNCLITGGVSGAAVQQGCQLVPRVNLFSLACRSVKL